MGEWCIQHHGQVKSVLRELVFVLIYTFYNRTVNFWLTMSAEFCVNFYVN